MGHSPGECEWDVLPILLFPPPISLGTCSAASNAVDMEAASHSNCSCAPGPLGEGQQAQQEQLQAPAVSVLLPANASSPSPAPNGFEGEVDMGKGMGKAKGTRRESKQRKKRGDGRTRSPWPVGLSSEEAVPRVVEDAECMVPRQVGNCSAQTNGRHVDIVVVTAMWGREPQTRVRGRGKGGKGCGCLYNGIPPSIFDSI